MLPISDTIPRAALVIGGRMPHGQAIARSLAKAGFTVAVQIWSDTDAPPPAGMIALVADLDDEAQTEALPGRASEALGPIGVLVNAASVVRRDPSRANWDECFAVNARAPLVLTRQFAKLLPEGREGVVINMAYVGIRSRHVTFGASQSALWTVTQSLALALAPRIRVNAIGAAPNAGELSPDDVADAAMAILALPSMTGQMIVPNGVPRPHA